MMMSLSLYGAEGIISAFDSYIIFIVTKEEFVLETAEGASLNTILSAESKYIACRSRQTCSS